MVIFYARVLFTDEHVGKAVNGDMRGGKDHEGVFFIM